ncbi:MAG: hypothetical protein P4L22_04760 [Candidatus Babeliales bacterium]|nr:hypothetical protein [Candidatus Babeliales bacterium]
MIENKLLILILLFTLTTHSSELQVNSLQKVKTVTSNVCNFFGFNQQGVAQGLDPEYVKEARTHIKSLKPSQRFTLSKRLFYAWCITIVTLQSIVFANSVDKYNNRDLAFLHHDQCLNLEGLFDFDTFKEKHCQRFEICKEGRGYPEFLNECKKSCAKLKPGMAKLNCHFSCDNVYSKCSDTECLANEFCAQDYKYSYLNSINQCLKPTSSTETSSTIALANNLKPEYIFSLLMTLVTIKLILFEIAFN